MPTLETTGASDWAVVVGLSHYPELGDLDGPENDARAFHAWLIERAGVPPEHVRLILSSDFQPPATTALQARPTSERVEEAFDALYDYAERRARTGEELKVGRRLYIFLAGHGFSPSGDEAALLMANATRGRTYHVPGRPYANWFLRAGFFEEVILFMDCCRERYPQAPLRVLPYVDMTDPAAVDKSKVLFGFATKWSRLSREKPMPDGKVRGVFSTALLAALGGAAADAQGAVTARSLADYLYNHMKEMLSLDELKDDDVPKEPELVFDTNPNARFLILQIPKEEVAAARFPVTVHLRPQEAGGDVEILDSSFAVAAKAHAPGTEWPVQLARGMYLCQVPAAGLKRPFEVSGMGGTDVQLN
ncbi:caspase family protein [Myxococcaceae bacterium GXIMD 01537]